MALNDVLVFTHGGLPLVARCYGGEYCKMHPDHALITGFLSALNSFGSELGYDELRAILFEEISMVFETQEDVYVTLTINPTDDPSEYQPIAKQVLDEFHKRYDKNEILGNSMEEFDEFAKWIDKTFGEPMGDLTPLLTKKKTSFFQKVKRFLL